MQPYNVNFCQYVECAYLDGLECTLEKCIYNKKIINWWIWESVEGALLHSEPPEGAKRVTNVYYDPETQRYAFEREE